MVAAGLEFRAAQAKPLGKDAGHQLFLLAGGVACTALEIEPGVRALNRPGAHRKAELDVRFNFSRVGRSVEQTELDRALGEESVKIDSIGTGSGYSARG